MSDALHVVCPHCDGVNRVPAVRLAQQPNCGQCHRPLFTAHPVELTQTSFARHISRSDIPVLVDFWAPWCGPCKTMAPHFARAAQLLEPGVRLAKVDTDAAPGIGSQYSIRSIPTLILFRGGREVVRQAGMMGAQDIVRWVQAHS
ncbi:MAG: thioredoxin TrxC [Pseudomonadales bacterium]|jgi:thioredoxin 2|nr:thioredoxin TrxC [Pseudomonadales bacterium]MCP5320928.1 thioredoxin TrxC [Pseudomonadales bacterium]MCP5338287.1 thioredoxin TrxC [Pseudomonadales bacterium]